MGVRVRVRVAFAPRGCAPHTHRRRRGPQRAQRARTHALPGEGFRVKGNEHLRHAACLLLFTTPRCAPTQRMYVCVLVWGVGQVGSTTTTVPALPRCTVPCLPTSLPPLCHPSARPLLLAPCPIPPTSAGCVCRAAAVPRHLRQHAHITRDVHAGRRCERCTRRRGGRGRRACRGARASGGSGRSGPAHASRVRYSQPWGLATALG